MKFIYIIILIFTFNIQYTLAKEEQDKKACEFLKVELIDTVIGYSNLMQNYNAKQASEIIERKYKLAVIYNAVCKEII